MGGSEETANLLGGRGGSASASSTNSNKRGKLTVHRGQLYYGDVGEGSSSIANDGVCTSTNPVPPPASSSGRRYQGGGVSFDNTLVDIMESSSSDEYDECEPYGGSYGGGGIMHVNARGDDGSPLGSGSGGFFNAKGVQHGDGGGGGRGVPSTRGNGRGGGGGVLSAAAPLVLVACALLAVMGLVVAGTFDVLPGQRKQPWWQMEEESELEDAAIEGAVTQLHGRSAGGDVRPITGALDDRRDDAVTVAPSGTSMVNDASPGEEEGTEKREGIRESKGLEAWWYQGKAARVAADAAGELSGNNINNTTTEVQDQPRRAGYDKFTGNFRAR